MTSPAPSSSVWLYALSGMADAVPATLPSGVAVYAAVDGPGMYIYANVAQPWAARLGPQRALQPTLALAGASQGRPAAFRYVVETDVLPGMEDEFNAWYDTEHVPGLAAVPGTVRAQRFLVAGGSPRYHACYDLETIDKRGFQALLREIPTEDLVVALKTASDAMKEKVFSNVSSRAAAQIREESELLPPMRLSEIENVQRQIVDVARRLEEEGTLSIETGGGGDDVLV